jgi:hypothetical protein
MGDSVAVEIPFWFREQMTRLAGLKFPPAEMLTHWEALADVPSVVLDAAITRAQKTRVEFPSPAELREDCDAVAHQARPAVPEPDRGRDLAEPITVGTLPSGWPIIVHRIWKYYHEPCGDGGMEALWCGDVTPLRKPWHALESCGREQEHAPHEWVRRCTCWDSNPALQRKRDREQRFSDATNKSKRKTR